MLNLDEDSNSIVRVVNADEPFIEAQIPQYDSSD